MQKKNLLEDSVLLVSKRFYPHFHLFLIKTQILRQLRKGTRFKKEEGEEYTSKTTVNHKRQIALSIQLLLLLGLLLFFNHFKDFFFYTSTPNV